MTIEEICRAVARGYCTKDNKNKILDPELCLAIANEIKTLVDNDFDADKAMKDFERMQELKMIYYNNISNDTVEQISIDRIIELKEAVTEGGLDQVLDERYGCLSPDDLLSLLDTTARFLSLKLSQPIYKFAELTSKGKSLPSELDLDTYITIDGPGHYEIERNKNGEYYWIHCWFLPFEQLAKSMEDCVSAIKQDRKNRLQGLLVEI